MNIFCEYTISAKNALGGDRTHDSGVTTRYMSIASNARNEKFRS